MSGSGGGSSGTIAYPSYMGVIHAKWLDNQGVDSPTNSLVDAINAAYGNSPFIGATAFNPSGYITGMNNSIIAMNGALANINTTDPTHDQRVLVSSGHLLGITTLDGSVIDSDSFTESEIIADITALDNILTTQFNQTELPKFKAAMLNIGAVNSSSFVLGEAIMRSNKSLSVAKHGSQLRIDMHKEIRRINAEHLKSYRTIIKEQQQSYRDISAKLYIHHEEIIRAATNDAVGYFFRHKDMFRESSKVVIDTFRMQAVLDKEYSDENLNIAESDARWDMEVFKYGANMLGSVSGGVTQGLDRKSKAVTALGGALSGAAAGAAVGSAFPGAGTAIGAGIGAIAGLGLSFA